MRRFGIGIATLALILIAGCTEDTGAGEETTDDGLRCKTSSTCPVGDICEAGYCVEWTGCTPDSCAAGEICDENFECMSISDKCALSPGGCECHILNSAGGFSADGNPTLVLPAGASTEVVAVLATKLGVALPGALFEASVAGAAFTTAGTTLSAVAGSEGEAVLTVDFDNTEASCEADLKNLGSAPEGNRVRFYVVDDLTNEVIDDATVIVDTNGNGADDGNTTVSSAGISITTDELGADSYDVTVFAAGYNILSIAGLKVADGKDIGLPLSARTETPGTGGFTGRLDFSTYEKRYLNSRPGAIKVGIVTGSIPLKALMNFNLDLFIGTITEADCETTPDAPGCYPVQIANLVDTVFALPGGLVLGLASTMIKAHFDSVARPGRRFAWGLGGELEIADLTGLINVATPFLSECACDATGQCDADGDSNCSCDTDCGLNLDIGSLLGDIIPLVPSFATGLIGDLALPEAPVTEWEAHITGDYTEGRTTDSRFPKLDDGDNNYGQLSLREGWSRFTALNVPELPDDWGAAQDGAKMEGMISLTGVDATGYGFVPLGLGVGLDCTEGNCLDRSAEDDPGVFDGVVNGGTVCKFNVDPEKNRCSQTILDATGNTGDLADGKLALFHAPAFGGLEGYGSKTLTLALPVSELLGSSGTGEIRASGIVHTGIVPDGESDLIKNIAFPGKPGIPAALMGRTYSPIDSGHNMHWVTMATATDTSGALTTRWNVYFAQTTGFTAPGVPEGLNLGDPFAASVGGDIPVGSVNSTHMGFNLSGSTVQDLAANNGNSLNNFFDAVTGLSVVSTNIPVN